VHPAEVEGVLADHPAVAEVAVAGVPDPEWGQRLVAYVVPEDAARPPSLGELRAHTLERLAAAKAPRELVVMDELPRTPSGKILRRRLAGPRSATDPAPSAPASRLGTPPAT
jgi:acyl-CoA synthetase (AMP-forming)/AMP-acid ligase II